MKHRLGKVGLLFLVLVLALASVGVAFAAWTDTITISGSVTTGELDWEIVDGSSTQKPDAPDWNCFWNLETGRRFADPEGKNVATTTVTHVDKDTMNVVIDNAYPYYFDHIAFEGHGLGTIPFKIWKVNIYRDAVLLTTLYQNGYAYLDYNGDGANDLELWWGDNFGLQMHYCDRVDFSFEILVLQPAPQNDSLEFTIEIVAIQWNEYVKGPLPTPTP